MKKILKYILILIFAFLFYILFKLLPDFYLNVGAKAYVAKDYTNAYYNLKYSLMFNSNNITARRYYAKTLIHLVPTIEIQKELYKLSQAKFNDSAKLTADIQIENWRNAILKNYGKIYIEKVPFNNQILRWDIKKFPIKVCIENNSPNAPQYYISQIEKAFNQWQSLSKFIKFKFTDNVQGANILIKIEASDKIKKCSGVDCKYTVAYTTPEVNGNLLKQMDIFFYDTNNLNQPFGEKEVYNTALHEIGHALGIMGHSDNINDVMYMETSSEKLQYNDGYVFISKADLNTLNLLYRLIPDITNTNTDLYDIKNQIYAPIIIGNNEQVTSQKIQEAMNYIKAAPNLPNGYIDLASAYAESGQDLKAVNSLNQALTIASNDSERFVIYYNFCIIYKEIKDYENALKYAQMAKEINPTSDVEGLIASVYFNEGNKEMAKQAYHEAIINDPQNIINSLNYAIIYLKEYNFFKVGEIIRNLIKANPQAKDDIRVKRFILFTYL